MGSDGLLDLYPKINSIYKRDDRGRFIDGDWATDELAYLANSPWRWTEKVDGTNIRLGWENVPDFRGNEVSYIAGRTDNAQIPPRLLKTLMALMQRTPFEDVFADGDLPNSVTLYGEGYGAGIQPGGGNYLADRCSFVLFDVKVGTWWLKRDSVEDVAAKLGLEVVPVVAVGTIHDSIELVKHGGWSSQWFGVAQPEGLVGVPTVDLFDRKGQRILTKVKHKDFL